MFQQLLGFQIDAKSMKAIFLSTQLVMVPVTQLRWTCPAASAERFSRTHQPSKLTSDQKAVSRKWNSRQIEKNRRKEILITKWLQRLLPCSWHIKPITYSNNKFQWLANTDRYISWNKDVLKPNFLNFSFLFMQESLHFSGKVQPTMGMMPKSSYVQLEICDCRCCCSSSVDRRPFHQEEVGLILISCKNFFPISSLFFSFQFWLQLESRFILELG